MSLPRFTYRSPRTLPEALSLTVPGSVFAAGGTDLFVRMKDRICTPPRVIGLEKIATLREIAEDADGGLHIGAMTTLTELEERCRDYPALFSLRDAVRAVASPLIRNRGTLGGNICQESRCLYYNQPPIFRKRWARCFKTGGDLCHAVRTGKFCRAVYAGDLAGPLMAMGAIAVIAGPGGVREAGLADFFTGSGLAPRAMGQDEILTEIRIPPLPRHYGLSYQKLRLRDTLDYPLLGVSFFLECAGPEGGGLCRAAALVLNADGPSPRRIQGVGEILRGRRIDEGMAEEIIPLVRKQVHPVANSASTPAYRREMIPVLTRRAFRDALCQAKVTASGE